VRNKNRPGEESRPILRSSDQSEDTHYGTEPLLGQPYVEDDDSLAGDSDDESDVDSEDDPEMRKIRKKRLQETGGWWNYLKDFSIFLPYLIPRKDRKVQACLVISLLCLTCNRFLIILIPRQLGIITDKVLAKEAPYEALGIWLLLSLLSGESGLGLIEELAKIPVKQFSFRQISNAAFNHVMSLEMEFHAERDSAEVMKAIEQGGALTTLLETVVIDIAPDIVDLIVAAFFLYWKFNAYVSLAMVVASIGYVTAEIFTSSWNIPYRRRVTKAEREQTRVMHQAVQGWQTVLYFNKFAFEGRRYGEAVESYLTADKTWSKRDSFFKAFTELWIPATFFGLSCLILYDISQGRASAGDFVFYIQYWETLIWPLKLLSKQYKWLMSDLVAAERLLVLLQTKPNVTDKEGAHDIGPVKGHVEFKNVNFSYDPRQTTIKDLSISAKPGDTIALVGTTGAGKSTILKLLLRFYDVSSGQIEIDGHDICDVTLGSLREALGVVPQDPLLFNTSVMENLRYARPSATDEEVFAACRAAAIHDKILMFADRYDTQVGEQGVKLSRGELQRIAIARVFLKDPPIFILDEATSAVDTNTESEIQTTLDVLRSKRTTFVIAHRLSTIVRADQILVVDEGRIVERGTHQELLGKEQRYKSLWTKQIGGGLDESKIVEESSGDDD
jgi:ABC-type transport system involved in Fe-S cluster assembly fused permease/ATPase subunit